MPDVCAVFCALECVLCSAMCLDISPPPVQAVAVQSDTHTSSTLKNA